MTSEMRPIYTYSTDFVSLLTVLACTVRLPIYYACNARIRREINANLLKFFQCKKKFKEFSRNNASFATIR